MLAPAIAFVKNAVRGHDDIFPALNHFYISGGRITAANHTFSLSAPIDLDIEAAPIADKFAKAVAIVSKQEKKIVISHTGPTVDIRGGRFSASIKCLADPSAFPHQIITGSPIALPETFLNRLELLAPFVAQDTSRRWANSILIRDGSLFATNNITLVQAWVGIQCPEICIPLATVEALIKLKENPRAVQASGSSIAFLFEGDKLLLSALYNETWPDSIARLLNTRVTAPPTPVDDKFFNAVKNVGSFSDDALQIIELTGTEIRSDGAAESYKIKGCCSFSAPVLSALHKVATRMHFAAMPTPTLFFNDELAIRGAVAGIRSKNNGAP